MKKTLLLTSAILMTGPAFGYYNPGTFDIKPYLGVNIGYSGLEYGDAVVSGSVMDEIDNSYAQIDFNFGVKFGDYFGAEAFAAISSDSEYELNVLSVSETHTLGYTAFGAKFSIYAPVNEQFDLFATAGYGSYEFELKSESNIAATVTDDKTESGYILGAGAMYNFGENFGISAMYEYVMIDDDIFDSMSQFKLGARFTF